MGKALFMTLALLSSCAVYNLTYGAEKPTLKHKYQQPYDYECTPLMFACKSELVEKVKEIITKNPDTVNEQIGTDQPRMGYNALGVAITTKNPKIVQILLENNANPNECITSPLSYIDKGSKNSARNLTLLAHAIVIYHNSSEEQKKSAAESVQLLTNHGAKLAKKDPFGVVSAQDIAAFIGAENLLSKGITIKPAKK